MTLITLVVIVSLCLFYEPTRIYAVIFVVMLLIAYPLVSTGIILVAGGVYYFIKEKIP